MGGISRAQFVGFAVKIHWPGNQLSFLRMLELCLGNDERVEKGQLSGSRGHVYLAKGWLLALNDKEKEIGEEEGRQGEREVVLAGR